MPLGVKVMMEKKKKWKKWNSRWKKKKCRNKIEDQRKRIV